MTDPGRRRPWWQDELLALALACLAGAPLLCGRAYCFDDAQTFALPLLAVVRRSVLAGHPLGWTPELFGGYSALAAGQSGLYYPLHWLLLSVCGLLTAFRWCYLCHFWLLARGMVGFARRLDYPSIGVAAVAGVATLGGGVVGHHMHYNVVVGMAWTGPMLWLTAILLAEPRSGPALALLAACVGLCGLASHPQYLVQALLISLALAPWLRAPEVTWRQVAARLGGAWALGGALTLAQLLPLLEYSKLYPRPHPGGTFAWSTALSLRWFDLCRLFVPECYGSPARGNYDPSYLFWESRGFFGVSLLALAVAWAASRPRDRRATAGLVLALAALFLMVGRWNPLWIVLCRVPPFSLLRAPVRFMWLGQIGVALLAGGGLSALATGTLPRRAAIWGAAAGSGGVLVALVVALAAGKAATPGALGWLLAAVGLLAAAVLPRVQGRHAACCLLAIGLLELTVSWHRFAATRPAAWFAAPPAAAIVAGSANPRLHVLAADAALSGSVWSRDHLWPNVGASYDLAYLYGWEALPPTGVLAAVDRLEQAGRSDPAALRWLLSRDSVAWLVTGQARDDLGLPCRYHAGTVWLYENPAARPWAYAVEPRYSDEIGVVTRPTDPVVIAPVEVLQREAERWRLRARFDRPMAVVLSQSLYPGWRVTVDGQRAALRGAEGLFMSVAAPAGEHTVEFTFDNPSIWLGRQLSQMAAAVWLVVLLWGLVPRRRGSDASHATAPQPADSR